MAKIFSGGGYIEVPDEYSEGIPNNEHKWSWIEEQEAIDKANDIDEKNFKLQVDQFNYQKELNNTVMEREDNAYQRAVEDMKKAGLNPSLIKSGATATGLTSANAPQMGTTGAQMQQAKAQAKQERFMNAINMAVSVGSAIEGLKQQKLDNEYRSAQLEETMRHNKETESFTRENASIENQIKREAYDTLKGLLPSNVTDKVIDKGNSSSPSGFIQELTNAATGKSNPLEFIKNITKDSIGGRLIKKAKGEYQKIHDKAETKRKENAKKKNEKYLKNKK